VRVPSVTVTVTIKKSTLALRASIASRLPSTGTKSPGGSSLKDTSVVDSAPADGVGAKANNMNVRLEATKPLCAALRSVSSFSAFLFFRYSDTITIMLVFCPCVNMARVQRCLVACRGLALAEMQNLCYNDH
jgi:hypothetical protein